MSVPSPLPKLVEPKQTEMPEARHYKLLIDGQWVDSSSGEEIVVHSPVTGEILGYYPKATQEDVDRAVKAAQRAFEKWRLTPPFERAALVHRMADAIERNLEKLARLESLENGKPYQAEAIPCVQETAENFRIAAEDIKRLESPIIPSRDGHKRILTFYRPYGVWTVITPWNFPTLIPSETLAPGLAAGNVIIFKPSEYTPLSGLALVEAMMGADLPPGIIQCIPGDGPTVGDWLVTHDGVDAIAFTGSDRTGRIIASRAGLKHTLMEMGGNGPTIILDDADLEKAAELTAFGCFYEAGQVCCATERILVHKKVHKDFVDLITEQAKNVVLGNPFDEKVTMGPLCNEMTAQKMERHIKDAVEKGARLVYGGKRAGGFPTNLYFEPTVVDEVPEGAVMHYEESFGPLAAITAAESDEELLRLAHIDRYGLQMGLFTSSLQRAFYFMERLRTGNLVINDNTDYWEPHVPFGGAGGTVSGHGRIGGKYTMLDMVYLNTVVIDFMNVKK